MSDREELEAAFYRMGQRELAPFDEDLLTVARAVKERLAQMPEKCEHGFDVEHGGFRPGVSGSSWMCSGRVYPPELVERITNILGSSYGGKLLAVAVLDAINHKPDQVGEPG